MNVTDAIKTLTKAKKVHSQRAGLDFIKSLDMAISALEKQIPKKPLNCGLAFGCPTCESGINQEYGSPKYCEHCGQALDWGGMGNERFY